jgi:4-hydroxy-2-oxoheptanedioate aldolase
MRTNNIKTRLAAGETVYGTFIRNHDPSQVEVLGYLGWDFFVFDAEHGTFEPRDCENLIRAAELHDVTPLVRASMNQASVILRFLDVGAQGVQIPWVNRKEDAEAAVAAVKYQPRGARGLGGVRASDYGLRGTLAEYVQKANAETMVIVQIESRAGVERIHEIVNVPDVDVVFIGPTDLSNSYGHPGQPDQPEVAAAIERVLQVTRESKVKAGILVRDAQSACLWREQGVQFIVTTLESLLVPAVRTYLKQVQE